MAIESPDTVIVQHASHNLSWTVHDVKWIPSSARLVAMGVHPKSTGALQVLQLGAQGLQPTAHAETPSGIRCGTMHASPLSDRYLATGSLDGALQMWDLDAMRPVFTSKSAHAGSINTIDGCGGASAEAHGRHGACEIVTGGRDGCVRVWDPRCGDGPVAALHPATDADRRDCWAVCFGHAHNAHDRCIAAGYEQGDVKLFDLRANALRWECCVGRGVCALQFDRRTIAMNKLVAACMEGHMVVWDMHTQHPQHGFASTTCTVQPSATLFACAHLPQNRDVWMISGGDGTLTLCKYSYPGKRSTPPTSQDQHAQGVAGNVVQVTAAQCTQQPVTALDCSPDRQGLFACAALDQCVRVGLVTGAHLL